ncbi:MAG: hypothetical protein N3D11_11330 [Candidatus Sumerlaeia bacterium]|nr:hypothetical protein [Candidatus Sumerlaeia bacterium]
MPFDIFHAYLVLFFVGVIYAIVSALLSGVFGGDHSMDAGAQHVDLGASLDGMVHFSPLSPAIIATFLTAFGGTGIICVKVFNLSGYISLPIALLVGLSIGTAVFLFFQWIFERTQGSVSIDAAQLTGTRAEVITPIPANGVGEIAFVASGFRQNAPARSENGEAIESPAEVEIVRSLGGTYLVRRLGEK